MDLLGCCLTFPTEALLTCAYRVLVYLGRTRLMRMRFSKHAPRARELCAPMRTGVRHASPALEGIFHNIATAIPRDIWR